MILSILLATGAIETEEPQGAMVETPQDRWITFNRPGGFFTAKQQIDPSDVLDYVLDLRPLLAPGEAFTSVGLVVTAQSVQEGFTILESAPFEPVELENGLVRIWVTIEPDERNKSKHSAGQFEVTADTDSYPPRTFQRTGQIQVAHK